MPLRRTLRQHGQELPMFPEGQTKDLRIRNECLLLQRQVISDLYVPRGIVWDRSRTCHRCNPAVLFCRWQITCKRDNPLCVRHTFCREIRFLSLRRDRWALQPAGDSSWHRRSPRTSWIRHVSRRELNREWTGHSGRTSDIDLFDVRNLSSNLAKTTSNFSTSASNVLESAVTVPRVWDSQVEMRRKTTAAKVRNILFLVDVWTLKCMQWTTATVVVGFTWIHGQSLPSLCCLVRRTVDSCRQSSNRR